MQCRHEVGFWNDSIRVARSFSCGGGSQGYRSRLGLLSSVPFRQRVCRYSFHPKDLDVVSIPAGQGVGKSFISRVLLRLTARARIYGPADCVP
jgi:hypothetical protein